MATNNKVLTLEVLTAIGVTMAEGFLKADGVAAKSKRSILLSAAKAHAGDASNTKAILEGFAKGFKDNGATEGTVTVRKSEAKAVFEAVALTPVTHDNLKALEIFVGEYNAFIDEARKLRGKKEGSSSPKPKQQKLTAIQQDSIEAGIEKATPQQMEEIATHAIINIHKHANANLAGFQSLLLIQATAAQMIKNEQIEPVFRDVAEKILDLAATVVKQAREAAEMAKAVSKHAEEEIEPMEEIAA